MEEKQVVEMEKVNDEVQECCLKTNLLSNIKNKIKKSDSEEAENKKKPNMKKVLIVAGGLLGTATMIGVGYILSKGTLSQNSVQKLTETVSNEITPEVTKEVVEEVVDSI